MNWEIKKKVTFFRNLRAKQKDPNCKTSKRTQLMILLTKNEEKNTLGEKAAALPWP